MMAGRTVQGAQADDSLTARSTRAYETGGPLGLQKHGVP